MANVLIGPVRKMASDARPEGDVEETPMKQGREGGKRVSQSFQPATCVCHDLSVGMKKLQTRTMW